MQRLLNVLALLSVVAGCRGDGGSASTAPFEPPMEEPIPYPLPPVAPTLEPSHPLDPPVVEPTGVVDLPTIAPWSRRFSGAAFQYGYSHRLDLVVDQAGDVFVAGDFKGALDLGGGVLSSEGEGDLVVAKFDALGRLLWSKRFGDAADQIYAGAAVDPQGNLLLTGVFNGTLDFGDGPLKAKYLDMFLTKLDPNGDPVWSKRFGEEGTNQWASAVASDPDGNVLLTGNQAGTIDYGGLSLQTKGFFIFALKLDPSGRPLWGKTLGNADDQQAVGIAADADGDVVLAGQAKSASVDGAVLPGKGMMDVLVAEWTRDGELEWSGLYGDEGDQWLSSLAVDTEGNLILAGTFQGTLDFPGAPVHTSAPNSYEFFVAKLDSTGRSSFAKAFPTGGSVAVDDAGNILLAGTFEGSVNFGDLSPLGSAGGHDIFLTKLRRTGEPFASFRAGDIREQRAVAVAADRAGRVVLLGFFDGKLDLGGNAILSESAQDLFLAKLPR